MFSLFLCLSTHCCRITSPTADYAYEHEEYIYELESTELSQCNLFDQQQPQPTADDADAADKAHLLDDNMIMIDCDDSAHADDGIEPPHQHQHSPIVLTANGDGNITIIMAPTSATAGRPSLHDGPAPHPPGASLLTAMPTFTLPVGRPSIIDLDPLHDLQSDSDTPAMRSAAPIDALDVSISSTSEATGFAMPARRNSLLAGTTVGANGRYVCDCGKTYSTEASIRFHQYECGKEPSFQCPYCRYRAMRKTTLTKHVNSKHAPVDVLPDD